MFSGSITTLTIGPGDTASASWALGKSHGSYDLSITSAQDQAFHHQLAGRVEDGRAGISDPLMGGLVAHSHHRTRLETSNQAPQV